MDQKEINEKYSLFNIPQNAIPEYNNPDDFTKRFQICSVLETVNSTYGSSAELIKQNR